MATTTRTVTASRIDRLEDAGWVTDGMENCGLEVTSYIWNKKSATAAIEATGYTECWEEFIDFNAGACHIRRGCAIQTAGAVTGDR